MRVGHCALQARKIRFEIRSEIQFGIQRGIGGPSIVTLVTSLPITALTGIFAIVAGVESLGREAFFPVPTIDIRQ